MDTLTHALPRSRTVQAVLSLAAALRRAANAVQHHAAELRITWQRRREAREIAASLRGLDARTLQDIGFARCEVDSVAAEVAGLAEATRIRAISRI